MQWLVMLANDWRLLETVGWELLRHGFYTDVALQSARQPYKTSQHTWIFSEPRHQAEWLNNKELPSWFTVIRPVSG
jgi:hypothetical protein